MTINESVRSSLLDNKIIPEVVDDFTPTALLSIEYGPSHIQASLGNTLSPSETEHLPILRINPDVPDENITYTVVCPLIYILLPSSHNIRS